ncbi:unnamed protein product [Vitrella brassicaformis CCMP3155]|uniref:Flavin-containing monooxygenase n=2 Tax=Vitrella brassicaformis TaxID=1169539 RepID=A0A0G4H727_VITBC|nr:unnamed protein product [Vitrella brassicaformis CCMP3155]|eukprot:CEM39677.1 unnamed protein product [Vitrella brassicaformis CCMP3155]
MMDVTALFDPASPSLDVVRLVILAVVGLTTLFCVGWWLFWSRTADPSKLINVVYDEERIARAAKVDKTEEKILVVGAGFSGLAVGASFKRHGIPIDIVDANEEIGGNWFNGVYNDVHIISSRLETEYKDYPMPKNYPEFPSKAQMLAYLKSYAAHWGVLPMVRLETEVEHIAPNDGCGNSYTVTIKTKTAGHQGEAVSPQKHVYKGVIVCTGHHRNRRWPKLEGTFSGEMIHSKDYKTREQLRGKRVLTLGGGNSAMDVNADAAQVAAEAHASLRRGHWILPRTGFGLPLGRLITPWWPTWFVRRYTKWLLRIAVGDYRSYGLQKPDHDLYELHPTIHDTFLHYLKLGRIIPHPGVKSVDGKEVTFVDGKTITVDMIVCATGYHLTYPLCEPTLTYWDAGVPKLIEGAFMPGKKNYVIFGTQQPRYGAGALMCRLAELISVLVKVQEGMQHPYADVAMKAGIMRYEKRPNKLTPDLLQDPFVATMKMNLATAAAPVLLPIIERVYEAVLSITRSKIHTHNA